MKTLNEMLLSQDPNPDVHTQTALLIRYDLAKRGMYSVRPDGKVCAWDKQAKMDAAAKGYYLETEEIRWHDTLDEIEEHSEEAYNHHDRMIWVCVFLCIVALHLKRKRLKLATA